MKKQNKCPFVNCKSKEIECIKESEEEDEWICKNCKGGWVVTKDGKMIPL